MIGTVKVKKKKQIWIGKIRPISVVDVVIRL